MKRRTFFLLICCLLGLAPLSSPSVILAHQPYCELADLTPATPWQVPDAAVSYAYFGNLYPAQDVDYFLDLW